MAVRLQIPSLPPPPLLPLLLCIYCCVLSPVSPLTDANWPFLSTHRVFDLTSLNDDQSYLVRETVRIATTRMEAILKVLELHPGRKLLLGRTRAYCARWLDDERCELLNQTYLREGERCSPDSTFNIPSEHLTELAVYNLSKITLKEGGPGMAGINFILFVTSEQTASCSTNENKPLSWSICSQQSSDRRPVAGLINFCPQFVSTELVTRSGRLLQYALASLVRLMGFSASLMPDYQRKKANISDGAWEKLPEWDLLFRQNGLTFLQTPAVRNFSKRHFNCTLGIPLAADGSSWDPAFLLPSVLSAVPIAPGVSAIDEATLALLEDTGWYRANYSLADPILWGRHAGCWFSIQCTTPLTDPEPTFCSDTNSIHLRPDLTHQSEGRCDRISGTNCSATLPLEDHVCSTKSGNWRRLQMHRTGQPGNWSECLPVLCKNSSYTVVRNGSATVCSSVHTDVAEFEGGVRLLCVHISLVCPRLSTVLDLLGGFLWPQLGTTYNRSNTSSANFSASSSINPGEKASNSDSTKSWSNSGPSSSITSSPGSSSSISTTAATVESSGSGTSTNANVNVSTTVNTGSSISTSTISIPSPTNVTKTTSTTVGSLLSSTKTTTPFPSAKFSIRFSTMDYFELVKQYLVPVFKASLQRALAHVFAISTDQIIMHNVKPGSVIAIWENLDPKVDAATKLEIIKFKVKSGNIVVQINGVNYTASSVESYTGQDEGLNFPLMEVIIGSVVGSLLLIGFILAIVLVAMKHKLNRPRMQVQPRSAETSPTSSSQVSRQCSAAPSGVIQLAFLGRGGATPSARAVADVESTHGGRLSGGLERGISAGSVGIQFSNSALYFDA